MLNFVTHSSSSDKSKKKYLQKTNSMPVDDDMIESYTTSKEKTKVN